MLLHYENNTKYVRLSQVLNCNADHALPEVLESMGGRDDTRWWQANGGAGLCLSRILQAPADKHTRTPYLYVQPILIQSL